MKYIKYTMPLFKKAIKRNCPKLIHLTKDVVKGFDVYDFWFVTQKAVIDYFVPDKRLFLVLSNDLLNYGYVVKYVDNKHVEFVKHE